VDEWSSELFVANDEEGTERSNDSSEREMTSSRSKRVTGTTGLRSSASSSATGTSSKSSKTKKNHALSRADAIRKSHTERLAVIRSGSAKNVNL